MHIGCAGDRCMVPWVGGLIGLSGYVGEWV